MDLRIGVFLLLVASLASSEEVVCKKGRSVSNVAVQTGMSYIFRTGGTVYSNGQKCVAKYDMSQCEQATLSCTKFNVVGNKDCSRGDYLEVTHMGSTKRFCGTTAPEMTLTGNFKLLFKSNRRKAAEGVRCKITCSSGGPTTTPAPPSLGDCKCGLANRNQRIVGGVVTEVNEYPWQVGIVYNNRNLPWCGGSLIGDRWVMTAAHCTKGDDPLTLQVLLGEHDTQSTTESNMVRMNVKQNIIHEDYRGRTTVNDFALLELAEPIDFTANSHIRPVCLPEDPNEMYDAVSAVTSGWGTTSSGGSQSSKLQEVTVQTITNEQCKASALPEDSIAPSMLCAGVDGGGKDSCQGDSGGPLVTTNGKGDGTQAGQNYELIGVVSWGYGCAVDNYPGVYARVTTALDWIQQNTGNSLFTCPRV